MRQNKGTTQDWAVGEQPRACPECGAGYMAACGLDHVGNGSPDPSRGLRIEFECGAQVDFIRARRGGNSVSGGIRSCWTFRLSCDEAGAKRNVDLRNWRPALCGAKN